MTPFSHAIAICGLSQREAAEFLNVSYDTVRSWCQGRRTVPDGVWQELGVVYNKISTSCEAKLELIDQRKTDKIEFKRREWPVEAMGDVVEAMVRLKKG